MKNETGKTNEVWTDEVKKELIAEVSKEVRKVVREEMGVSDEPIRRPVPIKRPVPKTGTEPVTTPGRVWLTKLGLLSGFVFGVMLLYVAILALMFGGMQVESRVAFGPECGGDIASHLFWSALERNNWPYLPFEIRVPEAPDMTECPRLYYRS